MSRSGMKRMYGFFRCSEDNKTWESSHVYCDKKTGKVLFEQDCKTCGTPNMPYRVERITCSVCGNKECTCTEEEREDRHVDPSKPHRHDLCHKCQSGKRCQ